MTTETPNAEKPTEEPQRRRTTIEFWPVDAEWSAWKATEPAGNSDVVGRGATAHEAVANYVEVVRDE